MSSKNRKRALNLDYVKQSQQSAQGKQNNHHSASLSKSKGSSDFSEFQMPSKDINQSFTPFQIPKHFKQSHKNKSIKQKQSKQNKTGKFQNKQNKCKTKDKQKSNFQTKQREKAENIDYGISFKQSVAQSDQQGKNSNKKYKKFETKSDYQQDLIVEYDKKEFNDKSPQKQAKQYEKELERSRSKQKQKQLRDSGVFKTTGGICFEIDVKDFVRDEQNHKKKTNRRKQKNSKNIIINSNEEILKRRQIAFRYGQLARRRTFGYY